MYPTAQKLEGILPPLILIVNLAYELLNIQQSSDGLMSILSVFIIHGALVHVRIIIIIQLYFRRQPIIHIYKYKYSMVEYTQLDMYTFQL